MSGQLSDYWTISPNTTNELRIGFMGEYDQFTPDTLGKGYPAKLGLQFSKADVFPTASISNYYGLGVGLNNRIQGKRIRYLGPVDVNPWTAPPPFRRRGGHLPRRFHCLGKHLRR